MVDYPSNTWPAITAEASDLIPLLDASAGGALGTSSITALSALIGGNDLERYVVTATGHYLPPWQQGFGSSGAATADTANIIYAAPFRSQNPITAISTYIHTAAASTLGKMALYLADGPGGLPKTLVQGFETGADGNVVGIKDFNLATTFEPESEAPDGYWVMYRANGATVRRVGTAVPVNTWVADADMTAGSSAASRLTSTLTFATAWPANATTLPAWSVSTSGSPGVIAVKAVAA